MSLLIAIVLNSRNRNRNRGKTVLPYRAPMISQTVWARGALRLISMERIPKSKIWTQAPEVIMGA
jgi:hypothetical protein